MARKIKLEPEIKDAEQLHIGGGISESSVSLCIYSKTIILQEVTNLVGCEPSEAHKKGDVIGKRKPAVIGLWTLKSPSELMFEHKIEYLIEMTTNKIANWDELNNKHDILLRCAIFMNSWNEGGDLQPHILLEIGKRHWKLCLDIYGAEGGEIVASFLSRDKPVKLKH